MEMYTSIRKKGYSIYDICGNNSTDLRILVHIYDLGFPGDWQFYSSAIIRIKGDDIFCEYFINEWVTSIWQASNDQVFACSMFGNIHSYFLNKWHLEDLGKEYSLNHIWGLDQDNVFCCGLQDILFQRVGNKWIRISTKLKSDLLKIGGTSLNDLYIIGSNGSIFYNNGENWSSVESPTNYFIVSVLCVNSKEVYISGRKGALFRGSKNEWTQVDDVDFNLWTLAKFKDKILVAGRNEGILEIMGSSLIPFNEKIKVMGLSVIEQCLFAFMNTTVHTYDGMNWSKSEYDFSQLIPD